MLHNSLQLGTVSHRRFKPVPHAFEYPVFMSLLDLDEIDSIFERSPLWSVGRFNLVSFYRSDYLPGEGNLRSEVVRRIADGTGRSFDGRIFLLTHLRYLGFCFNPVSFYFCFSGRREQPDYILAEINNTPWNQRHCYVLDCTAQPQGGLEFSFGKQFHVSPFMPMDLGYSWRFRLDNGGVDVGMALRDHDGVCFHAALSLSGVPFSRSAMRSIPLRYPFTTAAVLYRIYWQAFRLWLKRAPFHDHPGHTLDGVRYEHNR